MPAPEGKGRISLIVFSGEFARVHYALATAAAALSIGRPATLFFTMEAIRALGRDEGWRRMPGADELDARHAAAGVGRFGELLEACVALGATVMVCEMGLKAIGLDRGALRADVPVVDGGLVTFLNQLDPGGSTLFI
jgi:peroxiredoxin family protein